MILSGVCCNYDQEWFELGEDISETVSSNNCTIVKINCAKTNEGKPEITIDTENDCIKHYDALIRMHSNNTDENNQKMLQKIGDIEKLFQKETGQIQGVWVMYSLVQGV